MVLCISYDLMSSGVFSFHPPSQTKLVNDQTSVVILLFTKLASMLYLVVIDHLFVFSNFFYKLPW